MNHDTITPQHILSSIGTALRTARNDSGLSTEHVAETIQLSTDALCAIEEGQSNPDVITLTKLCHYYGIAPQTLFEGIEGLPQHKRLQHSDIRHLMDHFLLVDQPNRGQLFKDFITNLKQQKSDI